MKDDLQKMFEQAYQINEMATIGTCYGQRVVTNSLDHGKPHIHYGKVKIYLPSALPNNITELKDYVEKSHLSRLADKSLSELLYWFKQTNRVSPTKNNFDMCWIAWKLEHPDY